MPCDKVVSLHYFGDSQTVCIVFEGGDITVIREEPQPGEDRIEIVGSVDAGISAATWSPDEELLAITTKADTVVFMSRSFEGITDVAMTAEDLKASNHVSVGWGKKETQFKGRGAKAMRDPTMPEKVDEGIRSAFDNGEATISWRGDGQFVAINSLQEGSRRLIRVYSREGVLDSVSEPVDNLDAALSWRPAGNLMASIQRIDGRIDVVFFERNGLRHGDFTLRLKEEDINHRIDLVWNSDSTVLAVVLEHSIQLWTMGNYHWYLKQEILGDRKGLSNSLVWDAEKPLKFAALARGDVLIIEYAFTVARGSTSPPYDFGAVGVVDGKILKLTPIRTANVPPPMAHFEIELPENIVDVAFNAENSRIAVVCTSGIAIFDWQTNEKTSSEPRQLAWLDTSAIIGKQVSASIKLSQLNVAFNGANAVVFSVEADGNQVVNEYEMKEGNLVSKAHNHVNGTIRSLGQTLKDGKAAAYAQTESVAGSYTLNLVTGDGLSQEIGPLNVNAFMPWSALVLPTTEEHQGEFLSFTLSANGHLQASDQDSQKSIAKNCTSFLITPAHLIYTTTAHLLKFIHIADVHTVNALEIPLDEPEKDERCRAIERGARLVNAIPSALSLVLQMPRGNLETIFPRAMVLAGIRKLVDEKNYKKAFAHCRTQRVDMNLLYDYKPQQFLENVALFIDQVKKISYIDLFLSSLREEDVTHTLYKDTRVYAPEDRPTHVASTAITGSKINKVCDAMLSVLTQRQGTNLQNIVTAHLVKSPPALEDGLSLVATLMGQDEGMADKAVEHICFLADVNKLYDTALGLYNLDLALLVAQQSQKDPREYLPFLQGLQALPEVRRRFAIDDHLQRYAKALISLKDSSPADETDEIDAYIVKHALYQPALTMYRYNIGRLDEVTRLYAEYLENNSQHHAAAMAYESLHIFDDASRCYHLASPSYWRESLFCLGMTQLSPESLKQLAEEFSDALYEIKSYFDAATIQATYLRNPIQAARYFCKGNYFASAFELATNPIQPCMELLEKDGVIDSGLNDALGATTELLAECKGQLAAQVPRIKELRERAVADPLAFYEGETSKGDMDIPDDVSVAASRVSTSASLFTRYTGRQSAGTAATGVSRMTSKNRRREERKRARGKKGSVYEEEYLVASVGRLIERVEATRPEAERLVEGLVRRGMREGALAVEALAADVVEMCKKSMDEVYGEVEKPADPSEELERDETGYRPIGGDAVFEETMLARQKKIERPTLGEFKKLSLLGV